MVDCSDPAIKQAYDDVRADTNPTQWAVFGYDDGGNKIVVVATGDVGSLDNMKPHFTPDKRAFGFLRLTTGDEESKRAKFVFIAFCGTEVSALKRAKMSVHKASVKEICRDFAVEKMFESTDEMDDAKLKAEVRKAGGADYSGSQGR